MNKRIYFLGSAIMSLMIVSCSEDSVMPLGKSVVGMAFDVGFDTQISSRAASLGTDEVPTRCVMGIYDKVTNELVGDLHTGVAASGGGFTFTISNLEKSKDYNFVFWADTGIESYTATNLREIVAGRGDGQIAFTGIHSGKPTEGSVSVTLKHAVAKLVVQETGTLATGDVVTAYFTAQNYKFDALGQKYISTSTTAGISKTYTVSTTNSTSGVIITEYLLAPNDAMPCGSDPAMIVSDFKLGYKAAGTDTKHEKAIPNVTFKSNSQTVIKGSFKTMSIGGQSFAISLDSQWGGNIDVAGGEGSGTETPGPVTPTPDEPVTPPGPELPDDPQPGGSTITLSSAGSLTATQLASAVGSGNNLKINGPMSSDDFVTLRAYLSPSGAGGSKSINLDLSGASFTTMPDGAFYLAEDGTELPENKNKLESLVSIILPEGIRTIPARAFAACPNLTTVDIPSSVTSIGHYAFNYCGIEELNASNVSNLGYDILYDCPNLKKIVLGDVEDFSSFLFTACPNVNYVDLSRVTNPHVINGSALYGGKLDWNITVCVYDASIKTKFMKGAGWQSEFIKWEFIVNE